MNLSQYNAAQLQFVITDAGEALECAKLNQDPVAERKYADQISAARCELTRRSRPSADFQRRAIRFVDNART